jgi:hypothetical protein
MTNPVFGPRYDWSLPADWREVAGLSDAALSYLSDFMDANEGDSMELDYLSEVVGAADLILQIPTNLRSPTFEAFNNHMRSSSAPRLKKVSSIVQLGLNPLQAVAGLLMFAAKRIEHDDIDFVALVANMAREDATLLQLKYCLEQYPNVRGDLRFEKDLGRAVYWYAFQEMEHWKIPPDFSLTPDSANDAMKRHQRTRNEEYEDPMFRFNVWLNSPHCKKKLEALGNKGFYYKKMSKGRRFPKIERAWVDYVRSIEARHKYVYMFAERSQWQKN